MAEKDPPRSNPILEAARASNGATENPILKAARAAQDPAPFQEAQPSQTTPSGAVGGPIGSGTQQVASQEQPGTLMQPSQLASALDAATKPVQGPPGRFQGYDAQYPNNAPPPDAPAGIEPPAPTNKKSREFAYGEGGFVQKPDGTTIDARDARIERDFADRQGVYSTLNLPGASQYSPQREQAMRDAGTWSDSDELRKKQAPLIIQSDLLRRKQEQLDKDIEKYGIAKVEESASMLGQDLTYLGEELKKMQASGNADPAAFNEMVAQYNDKLATYKQQAEILRPFIEEQQDIQGGFEYLQSKHAQAEKEFAQSPTQKTKAARQEMADQRFAAAEKDIRQGNYLTGNVLDQYVVSPVTATVTSSVLKAAGALGRTLDTWVNIPNTVTGDESNYSPFAEAADNLFDAAEELAPTPTQVTQPLFDKQWNMDTHALLPKAMQAATYMAMLGASGAAAGETGMVAAGYMTTEEDYYKEGIGVGMKPGEATAFSMTSAALTSLLEKVNPGPLLNGKTVKGAMLERVTKALRDGKNWKEAVKDGTQYVVKEGLGEGGQEMLQAGGDDLTKGSAKLAIGERADGLEMNTAQAYAENALLGLSMGTLAAIGGRAMDRPLHMQSLDWAVRNRQKVEDYIKKNGGKDADILLERLDKISRVYAGNNLTSMPPEKSAKVASVIERKKDIETSIAESPMDPALRNANGDPREAEVIDLTVESLMAMGVSREDAALVLAKDGMIEVPEGAKVKEGPGGKLTLEVKPPKEGEEGVSKEEVQADLVKQMEAAAKKALGKAGFEEMPEVEPTSVEEGGGAVTPKSTNEIVNDEAQQQPTETPAAPQAEDTGNPAGVPPAPESAAEEPVAKPVSQRQKERERKAEQQQVLKDASNVVAFDLGASGLALRYLASGGKVNTQSLIDELGLRDNNGKVKQQEFRGKVWAHDNKSKSIEAVADKIAEENEGIDAAEVRTELINALRDMRGRNYAIDALREYIPQTFEEKEREFMRRQAEDADVNESVDVLNDVEAEEADAVMAEAEAAWRDKTPEQQQAIFDELDEAEATYAAANAGAVSGETGDTVPRGQDGQDAEEQRLAAEAKRARSERDRFVANWNDKGQGLFAPEEGMAQQTIDGGFDNSQENFDARVEPLNERVRQADKALADYVNSAASRAQAAAQQTSIDQAPAIATYRPEKPGGIVEAADAVDEAAAKEARAQQAAHDNLLQKGGYEKNKTRIKEAIRLGEQAAKKAFVVDVRIDDSRDVLGKEKAGKTGSISFSSGGKYFSNDLVYDLFFDVVNGRYHPNELAKSLGVRNSNNSYSLPADPAKANEVAQALADAGFNVRIVDNTIAGIEPEMGSAEAAARKAAAILERAKLKPDQLYALPLPPSVWNGAIRAMQEVIIAGGKAADAIAAAIKHIQDSDWWKNKATQKEKDEVTKHLQDKQDALEAAIAAEAKAEEPTQAPPPPAPKAAKEPSGPKEVKKTFTTIRAYEGDFREEVKAELAKGGLTREVENRDEARERGDAIIAKIGIDAALAAAKAGDIRGGARSAIIVRALEDIKRKMDTPGTTQAEMTALAIEQSDLVQWHSQELTEAGREASMMDLLYQESELGFTVAARTNDWKKKTGEEPTEDQIKRWKEVEAEMAVWKEKYAEAEKRAQEAEAAATMKAIQDSVARQKAVNRKTTPTQKAKVLADKIRTLKIGQPGVMRSTTMVPELWDAAVETVAQTVQAGGSLATAIQAGLKKIRESEWYKKLKKGEQDEAEASFSSAVEDAMRDDVESGPIRIPKQMIREAVANGAKDIDALVATIKEQIKEEYPDATDREIRDAITEYGKVVNLNKDELSEEVRRIKRIGRIVSALEDIAEKKRPLRSGLQRDKMDAEERALNKELREAMKDLPVDAEAQARELRTALDAAKTRARNRIEDLQREIDTKQRTPRSTSRIEPDAELEALIAEKKELEKEHDAIFGDKSLTEEERLKRAVDATRRSVEALDQKIRDKNVDPAKPQPVPETPELKGLRERRAKLREEYRQLQEEAGVIDKRRLATSKKVAKARIQELERRIDQGDFSKKEAKPPVVDSELIRLQAEKMRLKEEYDKEFYKHKLLNRTMSERVKDKMWEAWGLTRTLRASLDLSFVMMQGGLLTTSYAWHRPAAVGRAFETMWKAMRSKQRSEDWSRWVKAQDWYPMLKKGGVAFTEPHAELSAREELFMSDWSRVIWNTIGKVAALPVRAFGKKAYDNAVKKWATANLFSVVERGAAGYLTSLRIERALDGIEMVRIDKGREPTEKEVKDIADAVNTLTGRASIGKLEPLANTLGKIVFSTRLWASAIKTATPYAFHHFGILPIFTKNAETGKWGFENSKGMTPTARKMAVQDLGRFIGTTMGIVALAATYLNNDDDDETGVEMDPRSTDFGKIKIGNKYIDPWGGRIQQLVFSTRLTIGAMSLIGEGLLDKKPLDAYKDRKTGELSPLGQGKTPTMMETALRMAQNKLAPSAGMVAEAMMTKVRKDGTRTSFGQEYDMSDEVLSNLYPIYAETVIELAKEDPAALSGFLMFDAYFGVGVNVDTPKEVGPKQRVRPERPERPERPTR